jgi:replicative DNA helicase
LDIEAGLITQIKTRDDLLLVLDNGVSPVFFECHEEIYTAIIDHYKKYNAVISQDTLQALFPNFKLAEKTEPLGFYIDAIKVGRKKRLLKQGLSTAIELIKTNPDAAERELQKTILQSKNEIHISSDLDVRERVERRVDDYLHKKDKLGVDGLSTSWDFLDSLTSGYHPGDLVTFIAEPKRGKTWLLTWQSHHIWKHERVPVLILTREMRPEAIQHRFDAIECQLPYDSLRKGLLTKEQEKKYFDYLQKIQEDPIPYIVLGYSLHEGGATVSSIIPKVERHLLEGGALFVDGIYLMEDDRGENDWRSIVNIAKDLKNLAQTYKIPVITTTQAQIQGKSYVPNMENIAYGKYLAQFVDALLSISQDPEAKIEEAAYIHLLAQREGDVGTFKVGFQFNPYCDFSQRFSRSIEDDEDYNL